VNVLFFGALTVWGLIDSLRWSQAVPRKGAITKPAELNRRLEVYYRRQNRDFQAALSRPDVAKMATINTVSYINVMQSSSAEDRYRILQAMPSYETFVEQADQELKPQRAKLSRRANGQQSRKRTYRIGELTCQGLTLPPEIKPVRLRLTIDGFVEALIRRELRPALQARHLWKHLLCALQTISRSVIHIRNDVKLHRDAYEVVVEDHLERITFGQFQKIFTRVRRSQKALR
jgi:hypothetical protein